MRRFPTTGLMLALCVLMLGCRATGSTPPIPINAVQPQRFHFRDGGSALFYRLDKHLAPAFATSGRTAIEAPESIMFFVAGSGCASMQYFLPRYFDGMEGESGALRILLLQKRFIDVRSWDRNGAPCSAQFGRADHLSRWLADQAEFMVSELGALQRAGQLPHRIILAGVSEGAELVPLLARMVPGVTQVVMISNGGMHPLAVYRAQQSAMAGTRAPLAMESGQPIVPMAVLPPPADPDAPAAQFGGRSWRYWYELQALTHIDNLLALEMPLFVAVGSADMTVPVASAYFLHAQFLLHHKVNLHLTIYPGADHGLKTNSHINLSDFWFNFDRAIAK